ncbi:MAG: methylated-DNA--[protein]-cysteine S-methyltransferase [Bacteroidales bacterium]|nr:methylated-DNA--[protein]-cysteine S-methyltransferase [Bacteroidales bacterium]
MSHIHIQYFKTGIGELILGSFEGQLCLLDYRYRKMRQAVDERIRKGLNTEFTEKDDEVLSLIRMQLEEYLSGNRTRFDLPLLMVGTGFQKAVWNALTEVPYGKTATYLDLAKSLGNKKAVRAVAAANGANALAIVVPCHRVVGSRGELTGYSGGLAVKQRLLQLEQGGRNLFEI